MAFIMTIVSVIFKAVEIKVSETGSQKYLLANGSMKAAASTMIIAIVFAVLIWLIPTTPGAQDILNFPPQLDNQIVALLGTVAGGESRPTAGSLERFDELRAELDEHLAELQAAYDTELAAFTALVETKNVGPVLVPPR